MGADTSASKTALLLACGYPFRADVAVPVEPENEAMARGNRVHEAIEKHMALTVSGEQRMADAARAWLVDHAREAPVTHEPAYAWDGLRPASHIGFGRNAYAFAPAGSVVLGTADVVFDSPVGRVVADWKTSERSAGKAGAQLLTLAMLAGADIAVAVELREDGTYREHGRVDVMPWDAEAHGERLRAAVARIPDAEPTPGDHCTEHYCPLRGSCPAYTSVAELAADIVPAGALVRKLTAPLVTPDDVVATLPLLEMVEEWIRVTRDHAKRICIENGGEIRLDGSSVWRRVESSRSSVRGQEALELARKLGASQDELAALAYTTRFDVFKRIRKGQQL